MKLSMRDQIIAAIAVVVVLALAAVFLLIVPQFQKLGELGDEIKAQDQEIKTAKLLLDRRIESRDNAARTSAELILLANQVPEQPELPALIIEVQDAADAAGVRLERIAPEDESVDGGTFVAYPVRLSVVGRWADYIDFLRRLNKMTRGVRVVSSSTARVEEEQATTATAGSEPETEVEVAMMIEIYTVNPNASSGATTPPAPTP